MIHNAFRTCIAPAIALILTMAPASAQVNSNEQDPSIWLTSVYDLYRRAEQDDALLGKVNYRLIVNRSSKTLAALFRRNDACEKRSGGVCALDWDFVINGQSYQLRNVSVGQAAINGNQASVTVTFENMGRASRSIYYFTRENGAWKVEDIETRSDGDKPVRIAEILRRYRP